jgi:phosphoesterase RecJ-like protein
MSIPWNRFVEIVKSNRRFLLTSHIRPDCDALGSELGLALVLEALGKEAVIVNGQATPPKLAFIDPELRIKTLGDDLSPESLTDFDVMIVLDTSAWVQLGPMANVLRATAGRKLVIDHHVSEDDLGAESFKDPTAEATGRLVLDVAEALGVTITAEMATPLFAAIATDTGWFRFSSTTSRTYRAAAALVDAGAVPADIFRDLYEQDTLGRIRLRGVILSRIVAELDGRLAHTYVRNEDFVNTGALPSDTEDAINIALGIAGTQFAVIFVEQPTGGFKISFRSRCDLDCSKIAEQFSGGGHRAAAGAFVPGSFEEVQPLVLGAVRAEMKGEKAP